MAEGVRKIYLCGPIMDADPKAYAAYYAVAQYDEPESLPLFQAEIARNIAVTVRRMGIPKSGDVGSVTIANGPRSITTGRSAWR